MNGINLDPAFEAKESTIGKQNTLNLVLYFSAVSLLLFGAAWVFANVFWPEITFETSAIMIFVSVTTGVSINVLAPLASHKSGKVQKQ